LSLTLNAYVFLAELPKSETGKVLKTALRAAISSERWAKGAGAIWH